ncbi:cysteate racemase [Paraburkholderia rhynchosiae]|uniref:Aspartate racemase n=1 Tax=Paraburkholderia rhynchosiae TaxID=487049 RepID=A0A2N7WVP3_9BURK|nr:amino acid racemase [Paraburkholderia rhynchosiae]PMS33460.1 aspartate racemase [Paraburkholderia rhynchosiae]CAB3681902.1 Glutamate racemase [Paraburkholderia rhynchosiae]
MKQGLQTGTRKFGVVGGLGPLASADIFFKLVKSTPATSDAEYLDVVFEQHAFRTSGTGTEATTERKLYVFDMIDAFEKQGVTTVVLPCFLSHTFIDELKANSPLQIVDMVEAIRCYVRRKYPAARRIGVLASDYTRRKGLFDKYFASPEFEVFYPRGRKSLDLVTEAVYGSDGVKSGNLRGRPVELLREACHDVVSQGVDIIIPALTEIPLVAAEIGPLPVPLLDSNLAYAQYVVCGQYASPDRPFKVGIVGGVGPAATVDFIHKIVRNTPARRDQDHIKLLVEHNPQIPDRTESLIGDGPDPTISLYATCKKLESGDADIIAIPCNTAHAFVERIQPYLGIPIVNMLTVTVRYLRETFPSLHSVGVLATSGTIQSGVYERALASQGLQQVVPGPALQARVMDAIYGEEGVKAGFATGHCQSDIAAAIDGLISKGVEVVILGCTELPLLLPQAHFIGSSGVSVRLVDPTEVLARQCVAYATAAAAAAAHDL